MEIQNIENQNNKKNRKARTPKNQLYKIQQLEIAQKLINILDPSSNSTFILHEVDTNHDKIKQIMNLQPQVKKYFYISQVIGAKADAGTKLGCKRPWLSMLRAVLKDTGFTLNSKDFRMKNSLDNISYINTKRYFISKLDKN